MKFLFTIVLTTTCLFSFAQTEIEAKKLCRKYINNGQSFTENNLVNGQKEGFWTMYIDSNRQFQESVQPNTLFFIVYYENDLPAGTCYLCDQRSKLLEYGTFAKEEGWVKNGTFRWYDRNEAIIIEETYVDGKRHGNKTEFYASGQVEYVSTYSNDTLLKSSNFRKNGTLLGTKTYHYGQDTVMILELFDESGNLKEVSRYVNGVANGKHVTYYPDGGVMSEGVNQDGIRVTEKLFTIDGRLEQECDCDMSGENCIVKMYDKKGLVKKTLFTTHELRYPWEL